MLECVAASRAGSPDCFAKAKLLGEGLHRDGVFALVAVDAPKQNQRVRCLGAIARRLVEVQRGLEVRHRFIGGAVLCTQTAKRKAGPGFQTRRLVLAG